MNEPTSLVSSLLAPEAPAQAAAGRESIATCSECLGSGGWYRYEPALDPGPGLMVLSCVHCRGTGRTLEPRAA
jgi:DnaJ-class molecular chaperone